MNNGSLTPNGKDVIADDMYAVNLQILTAVSIVLTLSACSSHRVTKNDFDPRAPIEKGGPEFKSVNSETPLDPALLKPPTEPYQLGVGDIVEIEIAEIEGSRAETFVVPDGKIYFDLAGGVDVEGLTLPEAREALTEALKKDYTAPLINLTLREVNSRRVWILGRVFKPGLYPLKQPTTLLESISNAGGLFTSRFTGTTEELADLGRSIVVRDGEILPINFTALLRQGDMSDNIYLRDGDYVFLPSAQANNVFVLGNVRQPRAVGFKDSLTIIAAISNVKGLTPKAHAESVVIIRGSLQEPQVATFDLQAIFEGRATNFELQPGDVVYVPDDPIIRLEEYFWVIMNTAARTLAVREGARAADLGGDEANVVIPIN